MKRILSYLRIEGAPLLFSLITIALSFFLLIYGCNRQTDIAEVTVDISTEAVYVGEKLPLRLSFTGADGKNVVILGASVGLYDLNDGGIEPVEGVTILDALYNIVNFPCTVKLPASNRIDMYADGLAEGTYKINVSFWVEDAPDAGVARNASIVSVIKSKDGGENPPIDPGDEMEIDDFTMPEVDVETGKLSMLVGETKTFTPIATPATVERVSYWAESSNPDVVRVNDSGYVISITALTEGECVLSVNPENAKGPVKTVAIIVSKEEEEEKVVTDFTLPELDVDYGRLCVESDDVFEYTPVITPSDLTDILFDVSSTDDDVVSVSNDNGKIVIRGKKPGYCSVAITPSNAQGPVKTIPVLVFRNVNVTIDFLELTATEEDIASKRLPCYLRFSSDSPYPFTGKIVYTVTGKAVVSATGENVETRTLVSNVDFYGNQEAFYSVYDLLFAAWEVYRRNDYNLRVSLSIVSNPTIDPVLWRVTVNEVWKTQDCLIRQYLTDLLQ